jgi:hypothetical protein
VQKHWEVAEAERATLERQSRFDLLNTAVGSDDDRALLSEDDLAREEEAEVAAASAVTAGSAGTEAARQLFEQEQKLLTEMADLAESSRALPDARIQHLISWIRKHMCPDLGAPGAKWNDTRVIIFTEWDDTKRYLQQQLNAAVSESDCAGDRILIFHGPTPIKEREAIKLAF